jgi:hypothetical protein
MPAPTLLNSLSGSQQTTSTLTEAGGLEMKTNIWFDTKNGSNLPEDNSYVLLQDKYKSLVQMIGGNLVLKSNADLYMGAMQNLFTTVGGDHQTVIQGDHHDYTKGNKTTSTGEAGPKQVEAAKKLQDATHKIDKKKIDTIKKTKGGEVECPNCASEVLTDRGQCLIDEAIKIIRLAIPNFPYPLEVLEKILNFLGRSYFRFNIYFNLFTA